MSETTSPTRAEAVITVHKYEPVAYDQPGEGPVLTRIHVEESFSGDIAGGGVVEFLQAGRTARRASSGSSGSPARSQAVRARSCCRTPGPSSARRSAATGL